MSLNYLFNMINMYHQGLRYRRGDDIIDVDYEDLTEDNYEND